MEGKDFQVLQSCSRQSITGLTIATSPTLSHNPPAASVLLHPGDPRELRFHKAALCGNLRSTLKLNISEPLRVQHRHQYLVGTRVRGMSYLWLQKPKDTLRCQLHFAFAPNEPLFKCCARGSPWAYLVMASQKSPMAKGV